MERVKNVKIENYTFKRRKMSVYDFENNERLRRIYDRLLMVAMSVFEWKNLPETINPLFLERNLIEYGTLVFFKDEDMSIDDQKDVYLILRYMFNHRRDFYGDPVYRRAYADNTGIVYRKDLDNTNSVLIYDNIMQSQFSDIVYDFALQLSKVKAVIDMNLEQQKTPYIIGAVEEIAQEIQEFFIKKKNNQDLFIVKPKVVDLLKEALQIYPLNVELIITELNDYYDSLWNEYMVFIGIGTNATPKRERLVSSEVDSVNQQGNAFAKARLEPRKWFCKQVNEMFDLNIEVDYSFKENEKGGESDGTINDSIT